MKALIGVVIALLLICAWSSMGKNLPYHSDVVATVFWVGEIESEDNDFIQNVSSAWDNRWKDDYGGVDDPEDRQGYFPAGFTPKENPFYFALPFNDFEDGQRKDISRSIPWSGDKKWEDKESMCKNQWVQIVNGKKSAYAQWEDVGPFLSDDFYYVFSSGRPSNTNKNGAGIDISPAVATYLGIRDIGTVSWRFVDAAKVPDGPWLKIITKSQVNWE